MLIVAYILGPRGISNASCSAVMKIHFALLVDLVEWAIATHGMYESSQVCLVSIEMSIGSVFTGMSSSSERLIVYEEMDISVKTLFLLHYF